MYPDAAPSEPCGMSGFRLSATCSPSKSVDRLTIPLIRGRIRRYSNLRRIR